MDASQVRALLKDSQYDAAIAEARAARDAHKDDRSVREVTTPFGACALCNIIAPCTAAADRLQSPLLPQHGAGVWNS